jgi:hypothetical protein
MVYDTTLVCSRHRRPDEGARLVQNNPKLPLVVLSPDQIKVLLHREPLERRLTPKQSLLECRTSIRGAVNLGRVNPILLYPGDVGNGYDYVS